MSIAADDLRDYLLANAGVAAAVGDRMYAWAIKQGSTLPAVHYHVISRTHAQHLGGITTAGTMRMQLDVYASTRLAADTAAEAIVAALRTLAAAPATIGVGTPVCDLEIQGPRHEAEAPDDGSDDWTYRSSLDVLLNLG